MTDYDDEWVEVSPPTDIKSWKPIEEEGAVLLLQIGQGKFLKYMFTEGRYNLIGEVTNGEV